MLWLQESAVSGTFGYVDHGLDKILTHDSLSYTVRITLLPRLLRPQLAFVGPGVRLRHTGCGNAYTWNWGPGGSEYASHESGITWPCVLEDCCIRRYSGHGHECHQPGVGK